MSYFQTIYAAELPHRAVAVYMYLRDRSDGEGACWPSIGTIARELLLSRSTLRTVDYSLLATFVCFFIFSGNLGAIPAVRGLLEAMLARSTLFTAAAASQLISNVPAAVLLSGFTNDGAGLLLGTDLGGLGTPVASLASLISLKLYARSPNARMGRFLGWFAAVNLAGLVVLLAMAWAMGLA